MSRKKKQKRRFILGTVFGLLLILPIVFIVKLSTILPNKFLFPIVIGFIVASLIIIFFMFYKKSKLGFRIFLYFICILISIVCFIGIKYFDKTVNFLNNMNVIHKEKEYFYVVIKKDSNYDDIKQLKDSVIGYKINETTNINKAIDTLEEKFNFISDQYDDVSLLFEQFESGTITGILADNMIINLLNEEYKDTYKIIYSFDIEKEDNYILKSVNMATEPFNIFIGATDTRTDSFDDLAQNDVNILVSVNPKTHKILLVNIPRDYYVQLHGTTGLKDKLTHAGYYGINMSVQTIEDLFGIDINYYLKVKFSTVIKVVDILGGIDVESDTALNGLTHGKNCYIKVGMNHLNSSCALAYARERYGYSTGDRHRGENQMAIITSIINKLMSKELLLNYSSVLNSLDGSFQTNIPNSDVYKFVKLQLDSMPKWDIKSISVDGSNGYGETYSYPGLELYVMRPYEETVTNAIKEIKKIQNGR